MAVVLASLLVVSPAAVAADPAECPDAAPDTAAARAAALACGGRVEVLDRRTSYTQVFAEPDGRLVMESGVSPKRVQRDDGSWTPLDLTIITNGAGRLAPAASVSNVTFSPGGDTALARVTAESGQTFALAWPTTLPVPVLNGNEATYPEVYPGVDLTVTATETGFRHVLVVKNAEAAANPALDEVAYGLAGDAEVIEAKDGSLHAIADGKEFLSSSGARMWDSATSEVPATSETQARLLGAEVTTEVPAPNSAMLDVEVSDGELRLITDPEVLAGSETVYPVFIDPPWHDESPKWAYANSADESHGADPSNAEARIGIDPDPYHHWRYRSLFRFDTGDLNGKQILSAKFSIELHHTWICYETGDNPRTTPIYYYRSKSITSGRVSWSNASPSKYLGHKDILGANKGSDVDCASSRTPVIDFADADLRSDLQYGADHDWSGYTVMMAARSSSGSGESTQSRWAKFYESTAELVVEYNSYPAKPTSMTVGGTACGDGEVIVAGPDQVLSAVYPDDDGTQKLAAFFEYRQVGGTTTGATTTGIVAGNRGSTTAANLTDGAHYEWRVRSQDPYDQYSSWTDWCGFLVDATRPAAPSVTSTSFPECTDTDCVPTGTPGVAGSFTFQADSADTVEVAYGWSSPPTTSAPASPGMPVTLDITPHTYGLNTLFVAAVDDAGNLSQTASYSFRVAEPSRPIAGWNLEGPPGSGVDGLSNTVPGGPAITPVGGLGWASDARLVGRDTASFGNGGYVRTAGPLLDTTASYAVSGWVRLGSKATYQNFVTQIGSYNNAFYLGYRQGTDRWALRFTSTDAADGFSWDVAESTSVPQIGEWTHLAAAYDAASGVGTLYVNGIPEASVDVGPRFATSGPVIVGASLYQGSMTDFWQGQIAKVRVYDRALAPEDFTVGSKAMFLPPLIDPTMVGTWNFDRFDGSDASVWQRPVTLSPTASVVELANGPVLQTVNGSGYAETAVPVLRTDQSFTVAGWGKIDQFGDYSTIVSQDGAVMGSFRLQYRANENSWCMTLRTADVDDAPLTAACQDQASTLDITHLVGVYDRADSEIRLYVNGELAAATAMPTTMWNSTGALAIGRSMDVDNPGDHQCDMFDGQIDDVRAWQGAFTDAQAAALYDSVTSATN